MPLFASLIAVCCKTGKSPADQASLPKKRGLLYFWGLNNTMGLKLVWVLSLFFFFFEEGKPRSEPSIAELSAEVQDRQESQAQGRGLAGLDPRGYWSGTGCLVSNFTDPDPISLCMQNTSG